MKLYKMTKILCAYKFYVENIDKIKELMYSNSEKKTVTYIK